MWHYGEAMSQKSEASFEEREAAVDAARDASTYLDDVFAVWSDDDPANPYALALGGTVYTA